MKSFMTVASLAAIANSHFLQCEAPDSLVEVHELEHYDPALIQGVTCNSWPFYSGGWPKPPYHTPDSSSSDEDSDSDEVPIVDIPKDSIRYGFTDTAESTTCVSFANGHCSKWVVTRKESEEHAKHRCGSHDPVSIITEYEMCLCADDNHGEGENGLFSTLAPVNSFCASWACLETASYPTDIDQYTLVVDNEFMVESSSSSSDSSSSDSDEWDPAVVYAEDHYRFVQNGEILALDESMEFKNCWCKSSSINGQYCLNWFCESLAHDQFGCHKEGFGVDNYGWFGCYEDAKDTSTLQCPQWYGFMIDHATRNEYRCECSDESCASWECGTVEIPLRENYLWWNFPLAIFLWVCLCGCCGTKACFRNREGWKKCRLFKCRCCRMACFFIFFGSIALLHGGLPALLFFAIFSSCSMWCAKKCENCKHCCRSKCSYSKKPTVEAGRTETRRTNSIDGENSRDESVEMNKTGHVRIASVDLDEDDVLMDGPKV